MSELLHSDSGRDGERRGGGGVPLDWTIKGEEGVGSSSSTLFFPLHYLASPSCFLQRAPENERKREREGVRAWMRRETPAGASGVDRTATKGSARRCPCTLGEYGSTTNCAIIVNNFSEIDYAVTRQRPALRR